MKISDARFIRGKLGGIFLDHPDYINRVWVSSPSAHDIPARPFMTMQYGAGLGFAQRAAHIVHNGNEYHISFIHDGVGPLYTSVQEAVEEVIGEETIASNGGGIRTAALEELQELRCYPRHEELGESGLHLLKDSPVKSLGTIGNYTLWLARDVKAEGQRILSHVIDVAHDRALSMQPPEPEQDPEGSVIYAAQLQVENGPGPVKIGFTRNLERRLKDIQCGVPFPLKLLGTFPGARIREREIHRRCAKHRLMGEWFKPHRTVMRVLRKAGVKVPSKFPKNLLSENRTHSRELF